MATAVNQLRDLTRDLRTLPGRERDGLRKAINDVARTLPGAQVEAMRGSFGALTPYTARAIGVRYASADDLHADVYVKGRADVGASQTRPESFLGPQIEGGARRAKRFEAALRRAGILPAGWWIVPGAAAPLDQYGNVPGSFVVRVMAALQAFGAGASRINTSAGKLARRRAGTRTALGSSYIVIRPGETRGGLRPGIWRRQHAGRAHGPIGPPRPLFTFVSRVSYRPRYPFFEATERHIERELPRALATRAAAG